MWLDEKVTLSFDLVDSLLTSYFEKINEESTKLNNKLDEDEINKLKKIFIKKILECQSCCKNRIKKVNYRDIFFILSEVYNIPERYEKDIDITTEIFNLTSYFYQYITGKFPLIKNEEKVADSFDKP
jgi:hypothetical protein